MTKVLRVCAAAGLLLFATACDSKTQPSETVTFTAQLSPANEVPPVTNTEATGSGSVSIAFTINRDSGGAITSATANFQVTLTGFPNATALTMAHIHRGGAGVAGPIVVDTGLTTGQVVFTSGSAAFNKQGIAVAAALAQEILSGPSGFYFNVHSALNGTGMARGQLVKQ